MTKTTSRLRPGRMAFLLLLLGACGRDTLTTPTPVSTAQAEAIEWSYRAADVKGVRLDAVIFGESPYCGENCVAGAWAVCDQHAVGWNQAWIEEPGAASYFKGFAAHEVCHVYYKDNLPCRILSVAARTAMEARATSCGEELTARM